jgi:two-component system sensor histidine kinase YesM
MISEFKRKSKKLSISKRIIVIYLIVVLIPICTLIYSYYKNSSRIIENEVTNSLLQTLKQCEININNTLNGIIDTSDRIFMDPRVQQFLVSDVKEKGDQIDEANELKKVFDGFKNKRDSYRIRLFVDENKMISQERITFFSFRDIEEKDWYKKVLDKMGGVYWQKTYKEDYIDTGENYVISCARVLKHSYNYYENKGVLVIDLPQNTISTILSDINLGKSEGIYIIDEAGAIILNDDTSIIGKRIVEAKELEYINENSSGVQESIIKGKEVFLLHETIGSTGWKIVAEIPKDDIIKDNRIFNNISVFIGITITFAAFVLGIFILFAHTMEAMNKQVKNLVGVIEKEGVDVFDGNISSPSYEDFTKLEKSIYNIIQKVKNLMEESYQAKIKEREAQLKALQAQINPHFLYNTLDTINWMAIKNNSTEISFMVNSLAKYFRLSLSKGKDVVSIKDELELAKVYLTIQQTRFKGAVQFNIEVNPEVELYHMPKLTLQPIIENAIIHGIQKKQDRSGTVTIEANKVGDIISFSVVDDGVGMEPEAIERLVVNLNKADEGSYGLHNVNERIRLFSGEEFGLKITSEKFLGTKVEFSIKAK